MDPGAEVKHVVLVAVVGRGTLTLVECADGSLRVMRDEQLVDGCRWEAHQMTEAAAGFSTSSPWRMDHTKTNRPMIDSTKAPSRLRIALSIRSPLVMSLCVSSTLSLLAP